MLDLTPQLGLILIGWTLAAGSPGPATLALSGTAMAEGRRASLALALGILGGSATWGIAAALGMGAVMKAHVWVFEIVRYLGAAYLLWLALKSARSALRSGMGKNARSIGRTPRRLIGRGFLLHLTNPKAILSWGAIYSIALPAGAMPAQVWQLFTMLICASAVIFFGYALLFSIPRIGLVYRRCRRWFEGAFALLFAAASLKILTARLV